MLCTPLKSLGLQFPQHLCISEGRSVSATYLAPLAGLPTLVQPMLLSISSKANQPLVML